MMIDSGLSTPCVRLASVFALEASLASAKLTMIVWVSFTK